MTGPRREMGAGPPFTVRRPWRNHSRNKRTDPLRIYHPATLADLVHIVRDAEREGCTVRAVGSHHAWSDIALGTGFVLEPERLARLLETDLEVLREGVDPATLVYCEAGMRLRELNRWLNRQDRALPNMGGYDAQTVGGAMSTATHGSGISFGPLASLAVSVDLVASGGRVIRVEPSDGPTDPGRFAARYPDRELAQDDHWFNAVSVGLGSLGVLYAVHLHVEPKYWLKEHRVLSTWSRVRGDLESGDVLERNRHYELLLNPYPRRDGEHRVLVTTRNRTARPTYFPDARRWRNPQVELFSAFPPASWILDLVLTAIPGCTPRAIDWTLKALEDREFTDLSYRVLNIGASNLLRAYSAEIAVPMDARNLHLAAVDDVIEVARRRRELGNVYHTAPISLRFVKRSTAYLAMMHGREVMTMELILLAKTEGGYELLAAYEEALNAREGRPHWGQVNTLPGGRSRLQSLYPALEDWEQVHRELNSTGVFDNPFTIRVGLARRPTPRHPS